MSDAARTADWPGAIESILDASAVGPERVAAAIVTAASSMVGADRAALVRWDRGGPRMLASAGELIGLPAERPPEGAAVVDSHPTGVVRMGPSTDLVIVRGTSQADLRADELHGLRILAEVGLRTADRADEALSALYGVATKLLASRDLEEALLAIANAASQVLRAEIAGIFLVDASGECLEMRSVVGHQTVQTARLRAKRGQGLAGKVFATGRVHRVDDWTTDPSITKEFLSIASREGTQSAICAPLRIGARTIGAIGAWRRRRSIFSESDVETVTALANLATVAVESARTDQAERESATKLRVAHQELERRYEESERSLRIHQELTQIALEGAEIGQVVRSLQSLTGGTIALVSDEGRLIADAGHPGDELVELLRGWDRHRTGDLDQASYLLEPTDDQRGWAIVVRVRSAGIEWGRLAVRLAGRPARIDIVAAEQAATVCALLVAREEAAAAATRRLETEFVWDLLEGRVSDEAEALVRARQLQRTLPRRARVVLVRVDGWEQLPGAEGWTPEQLERARGRIGQALLERLGQASRSRILARRANLFVVLAPQLRGGRAGHARNLGELAVSAVERAALRATAGIGGVAESVVELPDSFRQARFALSATSTPQHPVMVFEDLGILQFLLAPSERGDLDRFVQQTLGVLLAYDERHKTQLVPTIEAYLACDCNMLRAAEQLFVHPKTMRYRLQRMQSLTGLRFDRQEERFNLQLALKILHLDQT
jgi:sugar diacid utilization regulator/GAF domain-containing protein